MIHFLHCWVGIERIGNVVTYECAICLKTKVRVRSPVRDSPAPGTRKH